jgi:hypothetical protein
MTWSCIRFDYNTQRYICIATDGGGWPLAGVAFYREFSLKLRGEFLFPGFRGRNARMAV